MAFVIRSYPRCGTHMLRTALDRHPEITCNNEVFNPDVTPEKQLKELGARGIYNRATGDKEGFVVHGYTDLEKFAQSSRTQELWPILEEQRPDLIVVERDDLLRRAFSVYQARTTQRWHVWRSNVGNTKLGRPKVQAHEVEWQLKCSIESREYGRRHFPWAAFFSYEDIVDDWHNNIRKMQEIIGVDVLMDLEPKTVKQDRRPIQEMVSNYRELRDIFINTEYGRWFEQAEQNDEAARAV